MVPMTAMVMMPVVAPVMVMPMVTSAVPAPVRMMVAMPMAPVVVVPVLNTIDQASLRNGWRLDRRWGSRGCRAQAEADGEGQDGLTKRHAFLRCSITT